MLITNTNIPKIKLDHNKISNPQLSFKGVNSEANTDFAKVSAENLQAYTLSFLGTKKKGVNIIPDTYHVNGNVNDVVRRIDKQYQGKGLVNKLGVVDWEKVGWEHLQKEPLDVLKASDDEIVTFYHALGLAETKDIPWVRKYNETNVPEPLATYHTISGSTAQRAHYENKSLLDDIAAGKMKDKYGVPAFLDKPLINSKTGKFNLDFTVFDTETTGNRTDPKKGPVDKIIQIGAVKVTSDGEVNTKTAISQFVNPEMPIHPRAIEVHHITDEMVKDKPTIEQVLKDFCNNYVGNDMLVAYNAKFDIPMLNRAIDSYNVQSAVDITDKPLALCMDPFILLQRIHPFIGSQKKLGHLYKFLFGKNMEGAHDALDDVKGTVDVLKYCCYYLQKHCDRPLTVKDVLTFQFGGKVEGLKIKLNDRGYDGSKSFRQSYRKDPTLVKNFPDGWKITEPTKRNPNAKPVLSELEPLIGKDNVDRLQELRNKEYRNKSALLDNLNYIGLEPYGKLTIDEVKNQILIKSVNMVNNRPVKLWRKNIRTDQLYYGNDLPDLNISRQVMKERQVQDSKKSSGTGRTIEEVLKDINS
ncbi:MAG: 3'-5' exonuclease [Cyanobacteriota bacterium]